MPQHPTTPQPGPTAPVPAETAQPAPSVAKKVADLTVNKVLAGAGAAATTAVLGSYFGAAGTVAGAALGSVASTLATTLYQRSLDRTRDTIVARVRITPGRRTDPADAATTELTVPMPRVSPEAAATTGLRAEPVLRRPRRAWMWLGVTVLVFLIALLAVTGIEWAKGSTLTTGQAGTSVGRVLAPAPGPGAADEGGSGDAGSSESDGSDPDPDPDPGTDTDTGPDRGSDSAGSGGESATAESGDDESGTDGSSTPSVEPTEDPTPTDQPEPTATNGAGDRAGSEGDAPPTRVVVPVPAEPRNG
jgi:hypothetical protein